MPRLKTCIVEDSPIILESLVDALEELAPVQVVATAPDEDSARRWLVQGENPCDLVIVDLFLKGGSGLGVLRALAGSDTPRVVLTNYASPEMRSHCLALGADQVFDKSADIDALVAYCQQLAAARPA